jgi:squalene-hopene/tetraprenyl-beta-curcumene cyclase
MPLLPSLCAALLLAPGAPSQDAARNTANPPTAPAPAQGVDRSIDPRIDPRIDASRVTTLPAPAIEGSVAPVRTDAPPAVLRIAADAGDVGLEKDAFAKAERAISAGLAALARMQTSRGTWFEKEEVAPTDMEPRKRASSVAVTAMALKAFAQAPRLGDVQTAERARRAVDAVLADPAALALVRDGGIGNYVMSAVASGLAAVGDADARSASMRAIRWLSEAQWDESEGVAKTADWYGGAGYGNGKRPDLSNTQMMLDAMHDAGVSTDDPAYTRALAFLERTQNRKATNPAGWAQSGSGDGGFVYSGANGGESFASDAAGEGRYGEKLAVKSLRSYGSMTYAGFKSLLYAGLSKDDPRVKDALGWISLHFTFDENPGLGQQGYYYYIHAMSRALHASRIDALRDGSGRERRWRTELIDALVARQREDGTWRNDVERWEESNETLATVYCVLALEEAIKPRTPAPATTE